MISTLLGIVAWLLRLASTLLLILVSYLGTMGL